ncbi:hypothetical protein CHOCRA_000077 [Candidatus Hodgkinia cicadicola]|nr:hypothetical protein CHOCRA_000077 [Candidatus Hodgkinia cicadicola]
MRAVFGNVVVYQDSTTCVLLAAARGRRWTSFKKTYLTLGRRVYSKSCCFLGFGNNISVTILCAKFNQGNVTTFSNYILNRINSEILSRNLVARLVIFEKKIRAVNVSENCTNMLLFGAFGVISFYNADAYVVITNKNIYKLVTNTITQCKNLLILGRKHKTTPIWLKNTMSIITVNALFLMSANYTKQNIFVELSNIKNWITSTRRTPRIVNSHITLAMQRNKLLKLAMYNITNAFTSSFNYKINWFKILFQILVLVTIYKKTSARNKILSTAKFEKLVAVDKAFVI